MGVGLSISMESPPNVTLCDQRVPTNNLAAGVISQGLSPSVSGLSTTACPLPPPAHTDGRVLDVLRQIREPEHVLDERRDVARVGAGGTDVHRAEPHDDDGVEWCVHSRGSICAALLWLVHAHVYIFRTCIYFPNMLTGKYIQVS